MVMLDFHLYNFDVHLNKASQINIFNIGHYSIMFINIRSFTLCIVYPVYMAFPLKLLHCLLKGKS